MEEFQVPQIEVIRLEDNLDVGIDDSGTNDLK